MTMVMLLACMKTCGYPGCKGDVLTHIATDGAVLCCWTSGSDDNERVKGVFGGGFGR